MPQRNTPRRDGRGRGFENSERLRELLTRLDAEGPDAWRNDPVAAELMRHAADKYAALARKHGLDPWEAATAAFEAMRTPSVRRADDPWAVITRAVQITCIAENRANGLLCSVHQARRPRYSSFHDAERFSDRENPLTDYHPAFRADPFANDDEDDPDEAEVSGATGVESAVEDTIALLCLLGWEPELARAAVECICARLAESVSRAGAYESLRRDRHARALLDIPAPSWYRLLRIILGSPDAHLTGTNASRGVLLRLLIGESLRHLLTDVDLAVAVTVAAPGVMRGRP
jgi:AcrR family transcriptional regulator